MKNFKQVALGLIVGALAIGFSSFTTGTVKHKENGLTNYMFTHPAHSNSDTRTDYVYESEPNGCSSSTVDICTAEWSQASTPSDGDNPSTSATEVSGTQEKGDYKN